MACLHTAALVPHEIVIELEKHICIFRPDKKFTCGLLKDQNLDGRLRHSMNAFGRDLCPTSGNLDT